MKEMFAFLGRAYALSENELRQASESGTLGDFVTKLRDWVVAIGVPVGALILIYAGFLYITSQGNPDNIKTAKDLMIGVLVGYALIILASVLLQNVIGTTSPMSTP